MPAAYDYYDYSSYWENRNYEHESEVIAIKEFLKKIPSLDKILEIGAGFGRLYDSYKTRAKRIILSDPSSRLLKTARENIKDKKVKFIHSGAEKLGEKVKPKSADLVILVRVSHHIEDLEGCFGTIEKLLKKRGWFILEFPNKFHFLARIREYLRGNFTYPLDIFPKDIRSKEQKEKVSLPFYNYHPDKITDLLEKTGFEVIEKRSVSNIRNPFIKDILPENLLIWIEAKLQKPLSHISFGPSMFVLARKKGQ